MIKLKQAIIFTSFLALLSLFAFLFCPSLLINFPRISKLANKKITSQYFEHLLKNPDTNTPEITMLANIMPKGGDIHVHLSGALYAESYLDMVDKNKYCIYTKDKPDLKIERFMVNMSPIIPFPKDCISGSDMRSSIIYEDFLSNWSMFDFNYRSPRVDPEVAFFNAFYGFGPMVSFEQRQNIIDAMALIKKQAKKENIQYMEIMMAHAPRDFSQKGASIMNKSFNSQQEMEEAFEEYIKVLEGDANLQKVIAEYSKLSSDAVRATNDNDFKVKVQSYVSRTSSNSQVFSAMYAAFMAAKQNTEIAGFNILGPENSHGAVTNYTLHMNMVKFMARKFPGVNVALHAGELALGTITPLEMRSRIKDAITIGGAKRIGHGISIMYEDEPYQTLKEMRDAEIAVEINLTSNRLILNTPSNKHPVSVYKKHKVPFVISSDDIGISRNNLSQEYATYILSHRPSYGEIKAIAKNSIRYSFLSKQEKEVELAKLEQRFVEFEATVAKVATGL